MRREATGRPFCCPPHACVGWGGASEMPYSVDLRRMGIITFGCGFVVQGKTSTARIPPTEWWIWK